MIEVGSIKDSGDRRQFDSGAVRDISVGKGRCDLMPLDIISQYYFQMDDKDGKFYGAVLDLINLYIREGCTYCIFEALQLFKRCFSSLEIQETESMWLEVSKHFEQGAMKYEERNWEKGIPAHSFVDSAVRHFLKFIAGMKDEPHDRAFVWNLLCLLWTVKNRPEYNDLPFAKGDSND